MCIYLYTGLCLVALFMSSKCVRFFMSLFMCSYPCTVPHVLLYRLACSQSMLYMCIHEQNSIDGKRPCTAALRRGGHWFPGLCGGVLLLPQAWGVGPGGASAGGAIGRGAAGSGAGSGGGPCVMEPIEAQRQGRCQASFEASKFSPDVGLFCLP